MFIEWIYLCYAQRLTHKKNNNSFFLIDKSTDGEIGRIGKMCTKDVYVCVAMTNMNKHSQRNSHLQFTLIHDVLFKHDFNIM